MGNVMEIRLCGKIIKGVGGNYDVLLDTPFENNGEKVSSLFCRARGGFRHLGEISSCVLKTQKTL